MNVANGFFLPLLRSRGVKTALNVDGIEWERDKWGAGARSVFKLGAKHSARWADTLIYDAREIEKRWKHEFKRDGHYVPYGGESCDDLPPPPGLESGSYVLIVARFVPENTIQQFFDAAEKIAAHYPVVLVGSSGFGGSFDSQAASLAVNPAIHWYGHISDDTRLFQLWQHAGVYFHGHSVGGTNPALVQAMHCGAPTVARDTPYNREVLGDAGVYTRSDSESIASSITRLMSSQSSRVTLASAAKARARVAYCWSDVCDAYCRVVRRLLHSKPE